MRSMLLRRHALASVLVLAAAGPSCGGGGSGPATAQFVGPWTFTSGQLTPMCFGASLSPVELKGLNVSFTKIDDSTISLTANAGCVVHFHVSGNQATVAAGQTCTLDTGTMLGTAAIMITTWTLSLSSDHIDTTIAGTASVCTASGTGVLVRGTSDAGVPGMREAGGHDVAAEHEAVDAGAPEASADAPAPEAGTTEAGAPEGGAGDGGGAETSLEAGGAETPPDGGAGGDADDAPSATD
jgi:hypothetical protein